ncbi:DUF5689 domain-containing protein [Spongiivirga sp. MCCC 1A20706]|uniref:DUF5689 domain-containing protein n=1 Tax=Spongiivirga sp. MCCC 1A20706 TaxID=3160963 RepID=UPI0039775F4C
MKPKTTYIILTLLIFISCVSDDEFEVPLVLNQEQEEPLIDGVKTTFKAIKERFDQSFGPVTFQDNERIYIEGYVMSSDEKGNFFKELIVQNKMDDTSTIEDPRLGFRIDVNQSGLFSKFEIGRKVYIKLAGLSISKENGVLVIGKLINGELDRIPEQEVDDVIVRSPEIINIVPSLITLDQLNENHLNTLIQINNIQFTPSEAGKTFAGESTDQFDGERILQTCQNGTTITLSSSKFADFVSELIPNGKGSITAIFSRDFNDSKNVLQIRDTDDLVFNETRCDITDGLNVNTELSDVISAYDNAVVDFGLENRIVEGVVISSDEQKNFQNILVVQDIAEKPSIGIPILMKGEGLYQQFPLGHKIKIKLDKLAFGKTKEGMLAIGILKNGFITEIPNEQIDQFLFSTRELEELVPTVVSNIDLAAVGTLIALENLEVVSNEQQAAYAFFSGEDDATRTLINCDTFGTISLINSGVSTFANAEFPSGNGQLTAVVLEDENGKYLKIRNTDDVNFTNMYQNCTPVSTSNAIIFSELADPNNNDEARFIELYNASSEAINLSGWKVRRYTNDSAIPTNEEVLEVILMPESTYVISPNALAFENVYGFSPDLEAKNKLVADGNGDDNYDLIDVNGTIIDVFGVIGEDGTGTNHEFEDGRAFRNLNITKGNTTYTFSEWQIWNDTGEAATILEPQDAPEDFSPGRGD